MSAMREGLETERLMGVYLSIERASRDMLEAAKDSDWDRFDTIQADCGLLIDQVRRLSRGVTLTRPAQRAKLRIVRQIVRNEAQIRRLAQPWTDRYELLLFGRNPDGSAAVRHAS